MFRFLPLILITAALFGADEKPKETVQADVKEEQIQETHHAVKVNGQDIKYTAYAGTLPLKDKEGKVKANIFFVSYIKEGVENTAKRPITFCFNGGPGSSSVWLHMGAFGPKRVDVNEDGKITPPYDLKDNEYSILDLTDLVFIDPVSTGFSNTVSGEDPKQFHGVEEDIKSVAEFIRFFTSQFKRWDSPKFLAGESYGTTRAAGLALRLHDEECFYLNGVILISSVLNFQTIWDATDGNDLPYILSLPSFTATAWYHQKLSPELQKDLHDATTAAEEFALNQYTLALMKGDALPVSERKEIAKKMSDLTGLSEEYIDQSNLRVSVPSFAKELLRKDKRTVGRFDSRFIGIDSNQCRQTFENDPSAEAIFGAYGATFNQYVRTNLKWDKPDSYKILADVSPWNFGKAENGFLNVGSDLKSAMNKNPDLRIFVGSGAYDLATPYFSSDYTFNHLGLDPSLRDNIDMQYYEAGHMMYIHPASLVKLKKDLTSFYKDSL